MVPPQLLPHDHTANGPLFSRGDSATPDDRYVQPRLHPITACRWRLHSCTRASSDWPVGRIACTPLVQASKATVAWPAACPHGLCPRTGRIIDYFYLWGLPPPPNHNNSILSLVLLLSFPIQFTAVRCSISFLYTAFHLDRNLFSVNRNILPWTSRTSPWNGFLPLNAVDFGSLKSQDLYRLPFPPPHHNSIFPPPGSKERTTHSFPRLGSVYILHSFALFSL